MLDFRTQLFSRAKDKIEISMRCPGTSGPPWDPPTGLSPLFGTRPQNSQIRLSEEILEATLRFDAFADTLTKNGKERA